MAKVRAFIACDIPEAILKRVSGVRERLRGVGADVGWTKVDNIHITLRFLGDVEEDDIQDISSAVESAVAGVMPFEISIKGSGAFPSLRNPRVVWIGIDDVDGTLAELKQGIDDRLKGLGFEPEERAFRPHLTLGRVREVVKKEELAAAVSRYKEFDAGVVGIDRVIIYKSVLKPTGAEYTKLKEFILQN